MPEKKKPGSFAGTPGEDERLLVGAIIHPASGGGQEKIPDGLRALNQWVAWKSVPDKDGKKPRKVPINVKNGRGAQANKPGTWSSSNDVMKFIDEFAGLDHIHSVGKSVKVSGHVSKYPGYFFAADDPFCGIDLDDCRNPDTGEVAPWALEIIEHFNSFTELSQSGTGFHIIIKGQKPAGSGCKKGGIECYDRSRYFICTGDVFDKHDTIQERQTELEFFLDEHLPSKPKVAPVNGKKSGATQTVVDAQTVLDRALKSKKSKIIQSLLDGDNPGQLSNSEADLSLCSYLVYFYGTGPDAECYSVVDSIIRNSKRMRPKWDEIRRPADVAT